MTDPFAPPPGPRPYADRLTEHLQRRHGTTTPRDGSEQYQVAVLREFLRVAELAMRDEDLEVDITRRVLDRITYGCVPHGYDTDQRAQLTTALRDAHERAPLRVEVAREQFDQLGDGSR